MRWLVVIEAATAPIVVVVEVVLCGRSISVIVLCCRIRTRREIRNRLLEMSHVNQHRKWTIQTNMSFLRKILFQPQPHVTIGGVTVDVGVGVGMEVDIDVVEVKHMAIKAQTICLLDFGDS